MNLYLASSSPRRREILTNLGFSFQVIASGYEEILPEQHPDPPALAAHLAEAKMQAVEAPAAPGIIVTADTLVYLENHVFGKPAGRDGARRMLLELAGRTHQVVTAICVQGPDRLLTRAAVTGVCFDPIPAPLLDEYLSLNEWHDKAGAYGIQGRAAVFIRSIQGCYFNVVGFPVNLFCNMLNQLGYSLNLFR